MVTNAAGSRIGSIGFRRSKTILVVWRQWLWFSNSTSNVIQRIHLMRRSFSFLLCAVCVFLHGSGLQARTLLKNICRVKGQEENTLQGLGLVVGLKGTGDGGNFLPTIRSLATAMQLMGSPIGKGGAAELKDAKNVALVMVTVTVPAAGARQGDLLDCTVSSIGGAKSLAGGTLMMTPLQGPHVNSDRVYAFRPGSDQSERRQSCRPPAEFFAAAGWKKIFSTPFTKDGKLTLVLNKNYSDFQVAQDVAELVNSQLSFQTSGGNLAQAINQVNIEVQDSAAISERSGVVRFASAQPADAGAANRSPRGHQPAGRQHRDRRRRGNRRRRCHAQEHGDRNGRQSGTPAAGIQGRSTPRRNSRKRRRS